MLKYFTRLRLIGIFFALVGALILFQMVRIQTNVNAQKMSASIEKQYGTISRTIYPERGNIYDRWGHLLAGNKDVYEIGIALNEVENPETLATVLSTVLGLDYGDVLGKASLEYIEGKQSYVIVTDFVSAEKVNELEKLYDQYETDRAKVRKGQEVQSLRGLHWTGHLQRSYPEKSLASNILGFYNYKDRESATGFYGVEEKYNDLLAGNPVTISIPRDPALIEDVPDVPPGSSLVLTIDREIQAMLERVMDKAVQDSGAESGTALILDPTNGEILAMTSTPRMDLNDYWTYSDIYSDGTLFDRAISRPYEPGSVFKVLTMASALDSGTVTPETSFLDTGSILVGGYYIYNWDRGAWGPQDMTGCMQHSLNVCLSWVATQMGPTKFYNYMQAFGIGRRTNVDLAGEQFWPLTLPGDKDWYEVNLATNSFGQGVAVTPLQLAMAISSVANNQGIMYAPHVLKAYIQDGKQYNTPPVAVGSPITAQTAKTLTDMLSVSLESESSVALVPGYKIAGKTGTAEIPTSTGYLTGITNTSFVGWGPTDDPKFLVYVWLEKPTSDIWGSTVAAPVFSDIVKELVALMKLPPDDIRHQLNGQ
ncbi:cell division protein FtsI/penicillin-binding protein 2 [Longilinea arvoryzae]|uniref:Cell division protein FtsI/penicillin-binding protein 2 n=1 Tax=Longilinea arvoryzae TaxID=360412 RepID=A0A0S7BKT1_9CHLR|nr:penicillin-binding protein 2 [Longilinea arvoryzae]GAP14282.1 cell division protein FtsI/penicillin-binding protein 2 [Longilinea arvoryzae]